MSPPSFVLVTPAHNECSEVDGLVQAVRASHWQPDVWIVVDDSSTDGTGEAFARAGKDLPYLRVHRIESSGEYMAFRYSEVVAAGQVGDVVALAGDQVVDADDRDPRAEQALAEMGTEEAGAAGDDRSLQAPASRAVVAASGLPTET